MANYSIHSVSNDMIPAWNELAREAEPLFLARMADTADFRKFMEQAVAENSAFATVENGTGNVLGIISISKLDNEITWLAVTESAKRRGIGKQLLEKAIGKLDRSRDITVITFLPNDPVGVAARALYVKNGFMEKSEPCFFYGFLRSRLKLPAKK